MKTKFRESSTFVVVIGLLVLEHVLLYLGAFNEPTLTEYGVANTALMSIWLGREWRVAHYTGGG